MGCCTTKPKRDKYNKGGPVKYMTDNQVEDMLKKSGRKTNEKDKQQNKQNDKQISQFEQGNNIIQGEDIQFNENANKNRQSYKAAAFNNDDDNMEDLQNQSVNEIKINQLEGRDQSPKQNKRKNSDDKGDIDKNIFDYHLKAIFRTLKSEQGFVKGELKISPCEKQDEHYYVECVSYCQGQQVQNIQSQIPV
ncbi:hypothetical protein PPERSA_08521 [Pseudocohnilembus persalinus]|uniref:Uncharacterized protein n=1 Tax=Pseudocohnilembus persalinus TaxID=266149 RepID=A0A0V0R6I2_PSEPJ|nr:hypothetical protein PPERSA_08521 [Pseudocohnilembus persalinus]|eukprot:KRX10118.1 hypothetical protein PPERSA_08521 [Pseudocohnilembus persalinus]